MKEALKANMLRSPACYEMLATLDEHEVLTAREMAEILDVRQQVIVCRFWRARRKYHQPLVKRNRKTGRYWLTPAGAARLAWYRERLNSDTTD